MFLSCFLLWSIVSTVYRSQLKQECFSACFQMIHERFIKEIWANIELPKSSEKLGNTRVERMSLLYLAYRFLVKHLLRKVKVIILWKKEIEKPEARCWQLYFSLNLKPRVFRGFDLCPADAQRWQHPLEWGSHETTGKKCWRNQNYFSPIQFPLTSGRNDSMYLSTVKQSQKLLKQKEAPQGRNYKEASTLNTFVPHTLVSTGTQTVKS